MKRSYSDSDSDCDDVFDDNLKAGSPSQSCQISDRKKRRGVIEKRRRDRINSSLSELRRLVPSAFEKQGSAKLEKAEILQMTVDHLKVLHQKGMNSYNCDPHTVARDYRYVGFKECAAEVARYLVAVEGLDLQDPLRMRLLSHLQCFSAQREAASKASLPTPTWTPTPSPFPTQYNPAMPHTALGNCGSGTLGSGTLGSGALGSGSLNSGALGSGSLGSGSVQQQTTDIMTSNASSSLLNVFSDARCLPDNGSGGLGSGLSSGLHSSSRQNSMGASSSVGGQTPSMSPPLLHSLSQFHTPQFPGQSLGIPPHSHAAYPNHHSVSQATGFGLQQAASVKPYRPWGGELAY